MFHMPRTKIMDEPLAIARFGRDPLIWMMPAQTDRQSREAWATHSHLLATFTKTALSEAFRTPRIHTSCSGKMATPQDLQNLIRLLTVSRKVPMMQALGQIKALQAEDLRRYVPAPPCCVNECESTIRAGLSVSAYPG